MDDWLSVSFSLVLLLFNTTKELFMYTLKRCAILLIAWVLPFTFAEAQTSLGNLYQAQPLPTDAYTSAAYGNARMPSAFSRSNMRSMSGKQKQSRQQPLNSTVFKNTTLVGSNIGNTLGEVRFDNSPKFTLNIRGLSSLPAQNGSYQNSILGGAPATTAMQTSTQPTAVSAGSGTSSVDAQLAVVNAQIEGQRQLQKEQRSCARATQWGGIIGGVVGGAAGAYYGYDPKTTAAVGTGVGGLLGQEFCD